MNIPPYTIPLSPAHFQSALHKGLGRAWLHVKRIGSHGVEDAIIAACLHNRAYDPQCEGDRSEWLFDILSSGGSGLAESLVRRLLQPAPSYWDTTQRCRIAQRLARRGSSKAREYVYSCFRRQPDSMDVIGAHDIIELDGADGLIHVAEQLGLLIEADPTFWTDDEPISFFDAKYGNGSARKILEAAGAHSAPITTFLKHLDKDEPATPKAMYIDPANVRFKPPALSEHATRMRSIAAEHIIHEIETTDPDRNRYWFTSWGREADSESLLRVFNAMLKQSDAGRLTKYLRVFTRRALPEFDTRLLTYSDFPDAEVRKHANKALANYSHPDVRALALRRLEAGRWNEDEIELLQKNYQPGDASLVERSLIHQTNPFQFHQVIFDLVGVFREHALPEAARAMLFVYEESPCSNCRFHAVQVLIKSGTAPAWLLEECRHDAYDDIRELPDSIP